MGIDAVGISSGWFDQWANATWATDPIGSKQTPPVLRAPNGILQDLRDYCGNIRVPTLLIHGEWDADLPSDQAHAYFAKLTNAPYKRFVEIGRRNPSDYVEKNRMQFFRELMNFLGELIRWH